MATYQGVRFIGEQLQSISAQSHRDWTLWVRDDDSSDGTAQLVLDWSKRDSRIRLLPGDGQRLGAARNFQYLLERSAQLDRDAQYLAFADQDDVWLPEKLETLIQRAKRLPSRCLVYSNARTFSSPTRLGARLLLLRPTDLAGVLFLNGGVHGCLILFDRELRDRLIGYSGDICMHDHLLCLAAAAWGTLSYVDEDLVLYRQHGANVTVGFRTKLRDKAQGFLRRDRPVLDGRHLRAAQEFFGAFAEEVPVDARRTFEAVMAYTTAQTTTQRLRLIWRNDLKLGQSRLLLSLKTILGRPALA